MKKLFVLIFVLVITISIGGCQSLSNFFPFLNEAPILVSDSIDTAIEDTLYSYQVVANDPNGDALIYLLNLCPDGMSINSENGQIKWLPNNNQVGIHKVVVEISDGRRSIFQDFEIEVLNMNDSPKILSYFPTDLNVNIREGDSVKFEVHAEDVDFSTTINYKWYLNQSLVSNFSVSPSIGSSSVNSWTYSANMGNYGKQTLKVIISDGIISDSLQWQITVNDITPPNEPAIDILSSPTNEAIQSISGSKEADSSILFNGVEIIPINSSTRWCCIYHLDEGNNHISITSQDAANNESSAITIDITLDSIAPSKPILNKTISPTNLPSQTLTGIKEENSSIWINGIKALPINSDTAWSYLLELSEGVNNISITSRDALGNESSAETTSIIYDLNVYVNLKNTTGIENGTETYPFNTIMEGIEAAVSGKSVIVAAEIYNEQLVINKEITLFGESRDNTFLVGTGFSGNLITILVDNVAISGFCIDGKSQTDIGISFNNCSKIAIENNTIKNNEDYGIKYSNSNPSIKNNYIERNGSSGIDIEAGGLGSIQNNSIRNNIYGIRTYGNSSPEINMNDISNNTNSGIYCRESATPVISFNTICHNLNCGILIDNILGNNVNPDIGGGHSGSEGYNEISGNIIHGVNNKTNHNIYAKNNWWGDISGPKYPYHATSSGDWVYWDKAGGNAIFEPYLVIEP